MAKGSKLTVDALAALDSGKLARIMIAEAEQNKPFRKRLDAAITAAKGPKAVAALIDARLLALEKARGKITWSKAATFERDLSMTVTIIEEELGSIAPGDALTRLFRWLCLSPVLEYRLDDHEDVEAGLLDGVSHSAVEAIGRLSGQLPENERGSLIPLVAHLAKVAEAHLPGCVQTIAPLLSEDALRDLDAKLADAHAKSGNGDGARMRTYYFVEARQIIAEVRKDIDGLIALELGKQNPNSLTLAEKLLDAGRPQEALTWVRQRPKQAIKYATRESIADGGSLGEISDFVRLPLEARILDALGERKAAQDLRWKFFEETLHPDMLRAYLDKLDDFEEFDALDKALQWARETPHKYRALSFLVVWPRLDEAAALVMQHSTAWNGSNYEILAAAAEALEEGYPVAATVLYRVLLNSILDQSQSRAYHYGALCFVALEGLAPRLSIERDLRIENPTAYRARLQQKHGRKSAFWQLVAPPKEELAAGVSRRGTR